MNQRPYRYAGSAATLLLVAAVAFGAEPTGDSSMLERLKAARSVAERKLDTPLRLRLQGLERDGTHAVPSAGVNDDPVTVQIAGTLSPALADAIAAAHGIVIEQSPRWGLMRATLPLAAVLAIAARPDVTRVRLPARARVN